MISRPELVRRAVELIGPEAKDRALCRIEVRLALREVEDHRRDWPYRFSKRKKFAKRLVKALERLRVVLNDAGPEDLRHMFSLEEYAEQAKRRKDSLMDLAFSGFSPDEWLPQWRDRAARVAYDENTRRSPQFEAELKQIAANQAYILLARFDRKIAAQKQGSVFCKLAAVLYGEPNANLREPCRETLAFWKKNSPNKTKAV